MEPLRADDDDDEGIIIICTSLTKVVLGAQVCYSREVDLDENEESSDTTGRYLYLLSCRRNRVRPCAPAAMQVLSGFSPPLHNV
jgi:hypothetical protein